MGQLVGQDEGRKRAATVHADEAVAVVVVDAVVAVDHRDDRLRPFDADLLLELRDDGVHQRELGLGVVARLVD